MNCPELPVRPVWPPDRQCYSDGLLGIKIPTILGTLAPFIIFFRQTAGKDNTLDNL